MTDEYLDIEQRYGMFFTGKTNGVATFSNSSGAANSMNVVFRVLWQIEVKDMTDAGNMKTTRRHIGRNQNLFVADFELL